MKKIKGSKLSLGTLLNYPKASKGKKLLTAKQMKKVLKDPLIKAIQDKTSALIGATVREDLQKKWGKGFTIEKKVDYGKMEIQVAGTQSLSRELKNLDKRLGKVTFRKQYVESSYPGRDGIGADVKVWNLCERCGEKLKPGKEVWLELDTRTNTYTDQEVPAEHSQGGFTFGKACAKKAIKEHKERS